MSRSASGPLTRPSNRSTQQQPAHGFGLAVEDLGEQVVGDGPRAAGEPGHVPLRIWFGGQRDGGQALAGRPAFGALVQQRQARLRQLDAGRGHQLACLVQAEPQVCRPELGQLTRQAPAVQVQVGIAPGGQHDVHRVWQALEQRRELSQRLGRGQLVQVIDDEDEVPLQRRDLLHQSLHERPAPAVTVTAWQTIVARLQTTPGLGGARMILDTADADRDEQRAAEQAAADGARRAAEHGFDSSHLAVQAVGPLWQALVVAADENHAVVMKYTRQHVVDTLRRTGFPEAAEEALHDLPDPVGLDQAAEWELQHGFSKGPDDQPDGRQPLIWRCTPWGLRHHMEMFALASKWWHDDGVPSEPAPQPLTPDEERTWRSLIRLMVVMPRAIDEDLIHRSGIGLTRYVVLMRLSEAPDRALRMSDLAEAAAISPSRMTRIIQSMAADGLVTRESAPGDGRASLAVLTDRGLQRLQDAWPEHLTGARALVMDHIAPADRAGLNRIMERLLPAIENSAAFREGQSCPAENRGDGEPGAA